MSKPLLIAALVLATVPACEKSASSNHASGALTKAEGDLLAHLPSGANIVFGGSLYNMQKRLADSAFGRIAAQVNPPELTAWNNCLAAKNIEMAGTATIGGSEVGVRVFTHGIKLAEMDACAKGAGLPTMMDPDGKFLFVELTIQDVTTRMPYLAVDGGLYGLVSMVGLDALAMGAKPTLKEVTRADLEREIASLGKGSAATDPKLAKLLPKIDRRKMFWFAGTAEGTPAADKVVFGYGSFSLEHGVAIDLTVKPAHDDDADRVLSEFGKMKSQLGSMPASMGALKDAIRAVKIDRVSDGVRVQMALSDDQIEAIMKAAGPMLPGGGM